MPQNTFEQNIQVPVFKVWEALITPEIVTKWMKNTKVETDWKEGSPIVYTCYDKKGKVAKWEGKDMIWSGTIEKMSSYQELTCTYPDSKTGLTKESYILSIGENGSTDVKFVQELTTEEIASKYKEGAKDILQMLKNFLEKEKAK